MPWKRLYFPGLVTSSFQIGKRRKWFHKPVANSMSKRASSVLVVGAPAAKRGRPTPTAAKIAKVVANYGKKRGMKPKAAAHCKPESKYKDFDSTTNNSIPGATVMRINQDWGDTGSADPTKSVCPQLLNKGIAPGSANNSERIGKRIDYKSLEIRAWFQGQGVDQFVTVAVIYDRRPNASAATPSALRDLIKAPAPLLGDAFYFPNDDNTSRFVTVFRENFIISQTQANPNYMHYFHKYVSLQGKYTLYKNGSGSNNDASDMEEGALYFVVAGTTANAANNATYRFTSRLRYVDC